ncbi:MAG: thrombospondin type 3 repeat-containing protein [Candidatus Moraniibacteriota bacterium]
MGVSQTKNNLRWSIFVFAFLCLASSALYVVADEVSTTDVVAFNDADTDGLSNEEEKIYGTDVDVADTDGDGYSDGVEIEGGFDPLKPAPGDRIVQEEVTTIVQSAELQSSNLTSKAKDEFAALLETKGENTEITNEDFTSVLNTVMATSQKEIELPEVDSSSIKVKKIAANLSDEERTQQSREDTIEYLTLAAYILLSNIPTPVKDEFQFENFIAASSSAMMASLVSGDFSFLDESERRAKSALDEINQLEVPENMVNTHMKAIQLLAYISNMKQSVQSSVSPEDPLAQMMAFSKIIGVVVSLQSYMQDTETMLTQYGIQGISLDL